MDAEQERPRMAALTAILSELADEAVRLEDEFAELIEKVPSSHRPSAVNLLHYLALRRHDLRAAQYDLHSLGLSSLGRSEAYALRSLEAVISVLRRLQGLPPSAASTSATRPGFTAGRRLLKDHTDELLGAPPSGRRVRIMVTMPTEAAESFDLVRELIQRGMDVMRINCASDGVEQWRPMIEYARCAAKELGRTCRVLCDLAGPNPRTGRVQLGRGLVRWAPLLDSSGHVHRPARVWVTSAAQGARPDADAVLLVSSNILRDLQAGDEIRFTDTRGRACWISVQTSDHGGWWADGNHTAVIDEGLPLSVRRGRNEVVAGTVAAIPPVEQVLSLRVGEELLVTPASEPGRPAILDDSQEIVHSAQIGCSLNEVFQEARVGQRIFFDDGRLGGVIRQVTTDGLRVEIVLARKGEAKLHSGKSINLPDTDLGLDVLTEKDRADLDFAAKHADMVGLSFVRHAADVERFLAELDQRTERKLGIVLKVETRQAFDELPRLLLTAMRRPPVGVMVARGDMGVELGFERLAEVQEEILWICEAAHVPVIWATQVLESLAKKGLPSRAEVTDAAMGGRAECVMLNKGPHMFHTVEFLSDILQRMQEHQEKKQSMLRKLHVSDIE
jgi:pyruvate kinase